MKTPMRILFAVVLVCAAFTLAYASTQSTTVTITVNPPPLAIQVPTFPTAVVGQPYTGPAFTASGGVPPYSWTATGLPPGMTINSTTGVISGTPTTAGTYNITVTVTDSASGTSQLFMKGEIILKHR